MSTQSTRPVTRTGLIAATVLSAGALAAAPLLLPSSAQAAPSAEPTTAASQTSGSALYTSFNATDTERIEAYTTVAQLSPEQVENARTIIAVGRGADIPDQGIVIALMTAMQESGMLNLDYGDRDSLVSSSSAPRGMGDPGGHHGPGLLLEVFYGVNPRAQPRAAADRRLGVHGAGRRRAGRPEVRVPGPLCPVGRARTRPALPERRCRTHRVTPRTTRRGVRDLVERSRAGGNQPRRGVRERGSVPPGDTSVPYRLEAVRDRRSSHRGTRCSDPGPLCPAVRL